LTLIRNHGWGRKREIPYLEDGAMRRPIRRDQRSWSSLVRRQPLSGCFCQTISDNPQSLSVPPLSSSIPSTCSASSLFRSIESRPPTRRALTHLIFPTILGTDAMSSSDYAVPDAAVPDAAMPDATVPEAAMPEAAMPSDRRVNTFDMAIRRSFVSMLQQHGRSHTF
jgi:hypothetical protein